MKSLPRTIFIVTVSALAVSASGTLAQDWPQWRGANRDGKVSGSYIGLAGQNVPLPRRIVRYYNLAVETGILVVSFEGDSPARNAGMLIGDIIVGLDDRPIAGIDDLHKLLTEDRIGRKSTLNVIRRTDKLSLDVVPRESQREAGKQALKMGRD
jgi:S1-C subfamily serine protease